MFNRRVYENSRSGGIGLLEVVPGAAEAEEGKAPQLFVPLRRTELRGEVTGPLAALSLVQTYGYSRKQCDKVLEAAYRFPLPGDAAVTGVRVRFGQVEIVTELKEREQAEGAYQEAVKLGKQAALLTRESPDVFTLRVAGIQPDQEVVVETQYVQLARPQGSVAGWLLRVPLTTAPRYVREDEVASRHAQGQPLALMRDPGHRFALDLLLRGVGQVSSPTHRIDTLPEEGGDRLRVRLHEEEVVPDRDFVLAWTPHQERDRPSLSVLTHRDQEAGLLYFLALVAPPAVHAPGSGVGREVILLVDHSGSMSGAKWAASDWAVNSFLGNLTDRDLFALGLFHDAAKWFAREPVVATAEQVEKAARYLDENRDSGGTNLGVALEQALQLKRVDRTARARHVLVITDAQVSDAARVLRLADQEAKQPGRRRISVLCIDAAPNDFLANELAERGGGVARFLTSSSDEGDITTALEEVLADWAEPVLVGMQLEVDRAGGEAAGREGEKGKATKGCTGKGEGKGWTVVDLGDLPCGRAVWVAGRVPGEGEEVVFRVATARQTIATRSLRVTDVEGDRPALKALFGARRLLGLEYLIHARYEEKMLWEQLARLGYDPQEVLPGRETSPDGVPVVYAENALRSARDALKPLLVRESLAYGLACAETAFIAVRTEAGKPVEGHVAVANALPAGWSEEFLSPPGVGMAFATIAAPASPLRDMSADKSLSVAAPVRAAVAISPLRKRSQKASLLGRIQEEEAKGGGLAVVFAGVPSFVNGQAVLFDSDQGARLPDQAVLSRIEVRFEGPVKAIDRELTLLLFVGDMALPRARIRLADLVRGGGGRPLNLRKGAGQRVRIVLADPQGAWVAGAPGFTLSLTT